MSTKHVLILPVLATLVLTSETFSQPPGVKIDPSNPLPIHHRETWKVKLETGYDDFDKKATSQNKLQESLKELKAKFPASIPESKTTDVLSVVENLKKEDIKKLSEIHNLSKTLNGLFEALLKGMQSFYMEKPQFIDAGSGIGDPVYYVNGILNTEKEAKDSAEKLSTKLGRPVKLIYNPSTKDPSYRGTGTPNMTDYSESFYDRTWWGIFIAKLWFGEIEPQRNPTTKQLTWLFYHKSGSELSIVTHSQGCMQARVALMTAALFGKEKNISKNVAWVTCGSPTKSAKERACATKWPRVKEYERLRHKDDFVEAVIGLGGTNAGRWPNIGQHFMENYVPLIENEMLFGGVFGSEGIDAAMYRGSKCYFFSKKKYIRVTRGDAGPGTLDFAPRSISGGWRSDNYHKDEVDAAMNGVGKSYLFSGKEYIGATPVRNARDKIGNHYPKTLSEGWNGWGEGDDWNGFGKDGIDAAMYFGKKSYFFSGNRYIRVTNVKGKKGIVDPNYPRDISKGWGNWGNDENWKGFGKNGIDAALYSGKYSYFFSGDRYIRIKNTAVDKKNIVEDKYPKHISKWNWKW